jgi:hypothetical protein
LLDVRSGVHRLLAVGAQIAWSLLSTRSVTALTVEQFIALRLKLVELIVQRDLLVMLASLKQGVANLRDRTQRCAAYIADVIRGRRGVDADR